MLYVSNEVEMVCSTRRRCRHAVSALELISFKPLGTESAAAVMQHDSKISGFILLLSVAVRCVSSSSILELGRAALER